MLIMMIRLLKAWQRQGIARKMVSMLIDEAWKRGATEISLDEISRIDLKATDEGYPLYKKLGFADKVQNYRDMRLIL